MNFFRVLFLAFLIVPIIEMAVLIEVGGMIGAIKTIGLVMLTAVIGVWLLRLQGFATLRSVRAKLAAGQLPDTELIEGVFLIIGGALLLTPGFVTDGVGFICLLPWTRKAMARSVLERNLLRPKHFPGAGMDESGDIFNHEFFQQGFKEDKPADSDNKDNVIEGEFKRRDH